MRRYLSALLLTALCLALAACAGRQGGPENAGPPAADNPVADLDGAADEAVKIDVLNVEFAAAGHDEDTLLALQGDFPAALTRALDAQAVEVGSVRVTFGTSGEATQTAMRDRAVQLAFLPAEDYFPYRGGMIVAHEDLPEEAPSVSTGLIVAAASDDACADERFTEALRAALGDLSPVLASYTTAGAAGQYVFDPERLEAIRRLCEESESAAHGAP